jgi:hypothetical protein
VDESFKIIGTSIQLNCYKKTDEVYDIIMIENQSAPQFPSMPWHEAAEKVGKATYRLYTGTSMGTGFLISVGKTPQSFMAILVTAWHVVQDAVDGTALRICDSNGNEVTRSSGTNMEVLQIGERLDSAIIIIESDREVFSQNLLLPILPKEVQLKTGAEVSWMGYPGIVEPELCYFHGYISGMLTDPPVYLVDGVAINGVSGGPVFDDRCHIVGFVSAYLPNQLDDTTTLPGVSWMVPINFIFSWIRANIKPRDLFGKF